MHKMKFGRQVLTQLALFFVGLFVLVPIWGLLNVSLDGALKGAPVELHLFPRDFVT